MITKYPLFELIPRKELKPMALLMATHSVGEEMALYFAIREFEYRHASRTWDDRVSMAHGIKKYFMEDDSLLRPNIGSGFNKTFFLQQLRMLSEYVTNRQRLTPSQAEQLAASLFDPFWACVESGVGNSPLLPYRQLMGNPKKNFDNPLPIAELTPGSFSSAEMQKGLGELILLHRFPDNIWNKN